MRTRDRLRMLLKSELSAGKTLCKAVLHRLAGRDVMPFDAMLLLPWAEALTLGWLSGNFSSTGRRDRRIAALEQHWSDNPNTKLL